MFINQKSFSLFIAIVFLLISNLSLLSASAATDDQPSLVELEAITINNPKIELLIYIDDLNQDFNNIQTAFPEIRLVSKFKATKKLYKYSAYEILGQSRTLLSTVSSQKTSNTLTLGNFEDIDQKNIEIEVEDRKGSVNVYKALIRIANTPSSESETSSNDTDASLFATCFTTQNSNDYDKCLELFFRKVTFTLGNSDAVVTNDAGNFVVTLPSAKVASAGPIGPSGPQGPKGDSGGDYWQLLGNNLINNGALSNIRVNNFVFGDSIIAKDGANKIAFEKSNASLRIGSTSAGEWNQRGANSAVIGKNSSATQDGSFSFGDLNKNESMFSFVLGQNNQASGGNLANLPGDETGTTTIKQKSFVVGYENIDDGGASFTLGAKNKN
ncbi:MAG: hypothetical protein LW817_01370, partial [Candidatus Caenarcaniphilales bacterium]|nr:hypothetical protein [Candidatus Caenarcaniphilales bacterium]